MTFEGALVKEQGVTFGIVIVKRSVLNNAVERDRVADAFSRQAFGGAPVVLMAQDARGLPKYWGRSDIVRFLSRVPLRSIPWRKYTLSASVR